MADPVAEPVTDSPVLQAAHVGPVDTTRLTGGEVDAAVVDRLVATLAAAEGRTTVPGVLGSPALLERTSTVRGQIVVAGAGVAVILAALLIVMAVIGRFV